MRLNSIFFLSVIGAVLLFGSFPLKLIAEPFAVDICRLAGFLLIFVVTGLRITRKDKSKKKNNQGFKLTYYAQLNISFLIILLGSFLSDIGDVWIFRSMAYAACGLLFVVHPVVPKNLDGMAKAVFWTRIAGVMLVLIGIFSRVHY